ncbi:hypothetical protein BCR41DRAFT_353727 [Lobosporangium transversale]|uniref:SPT2 chromatin protein-domain-containing protein n=1 Tax=Lobosporangium transversale TaxID=64571 RepID=A0A1Y2GM91_9FUNG|nr:hypothetical protein BCR41DRAFT_353727 [Lobosporangium transversale]ORZ15416.1 hypothetical protein BCR41DRAFT_353727 [Lobosporangium transversale]|eukprot:XP_021881164.1 hypothetical protein BCR41DRAFT_353727 [Lobosporangium transversale]
MGEFEDLKKLGTKHTRATESELQKKKQQLEYEELQRKQQEEIQRKRKEAETRKLLREELQRKKLEEEQRQRDAAASQRAKERAKQQEKEQERERQLQEKERTRKQRASANGPTYSSSRSKPTYSGVSSLSRSLESSKSLSKKANYSFEDLQKIAMSNGTRTGRSGSKTESRAEDRDYSRGGDRYDDKVNSRRAAAERLKVNRGISPERPLSAAQSYAGTKILKKPPVKRSTAPKSMFPTPLRSPGMGLNHVRDAGLKAIRDGPIPLNTKKRDLRTIDEINADLIAKNGRREERDRRMKAIEEERERMRQQREKALQAAKYSRALMGDDVKETERIYKEVTGGSKTARSPRSMSRSRSRSPKKRSRSRSPVRRKRSLSPVNKKRSYSPDIRDRSISPRRRRSVSPPVKRKMNRDLGDRERDRDRDRERAIGKNKASNGSSRRYSSHSPSPRPPSKKRVSPPRGNGRGRGPFDDEEELDVSGIIGSIFGTRYQRRAANEDLSDDDMEANASELFREEKRSARIAREEDEREAELERAELERRKRKHERNRG